MFSAIYESLLTVVYPQECQNCDRSVESFECGVACADCWNKTRIFHGAETLCGKCGRFLQPKSSDFQTFCHRCDEHSYDAARAVGVYEEALAASVINLKREPFAAKRLRKHLLDCFEISGFADTTLVIPVPLSKKRQIERGFNQAAVLGAFLAEKLHLPFDEKSLVRATHTPVHRAAMDDKARQASVKNVFKVERPAFIENENILLVDDVFTSGATVSACAEVLKKNGAGKIYVLTVARAV